MFTVDTVMRPYTEHLLNIKSEAHYAGSIFYQPIMVRSILRHNFKSNLDKFALQVKMKSLFICSPVTGMTVMVLFLDRLPVNASLKKRVRQRLMIFKGDFNIFHLERGPSKVLL
jgi:hypothetical protein